jgi:hypothetical protein
LVTLLSIILVAISESLAFTAFSSIVLNTDLAPITSFCFQSNFYSTFKFYCCSIVESGSCTFSSSSIFCCPSVK